jgi:hypothetical protein
MLFLRAPEPLAQRYETAPVPVLSGPETRHDCIPQVELGDSVNVFANSSIVQPTNRLHFVRNRIVRGVPARAEGARGEIPWLLADRARTLRFSSGQALSKTAKGAAASVLWQRRQKDQSWASPLSPLRVWRGWGGGD